MPEMSTLTATELLNALHESASNLSYFNAAEGDSWIAETGARAAAQKEFDELKGDALQRGIFSPEDFTRYLL